MYVQSEHANIFHYCYGVVIVNSMLLFHLEQEKNTCKDDSAMLKLF